MKPAGEVVSVLIPPLRLAGELRLPAKPRGLLIFAEGADTSRLTPRSRQVASALTKAGFATLLFGLLTEAEACDRHKVFDIDLLAQRLVYAIDWAHGEPILARLPIGLFGASTGAAAALLAAALRPAVIEAVVSRGGRPDLAEKALPHVTAPCLLIVGEFDEPVLTWNRQAGAMLKGPWAVEAVEGATHLFEEPGAMDDVVRLAAAWFEDQLRSIAA